MDNLAKIQFDSPSCGHHGPYTFFRSFSYRRNIRREKRSIAIGEFFFVRILAELPVCVAELQLLWKSQHAVGTKLASVKLYFTPDDTPTGRKPHHGKDELLVADEKVVLEIDDLVKWILESPVSWVYGFQISSKSLEPVERMSTNSSPQTKNGHQQHDDMIYQTCSGPLVIIVSFPRYCRYIAMAKRLGKVNSSWLENEIVQAISGMSKTGGDTRLMFCQETFEHPALTFHEFRKDRLAPKLKGRKRRKKFSRQESVESVDSDAGAEKLVVMTVDNGQFKPTVKHSKKFGLTLPQLGLELMSSGKEAFEQRLYKFMRERKTPIKRIPSLGFKEVDLFQFFLYSQKYGGYDKVTEGRHWKHIYDQMGGHPGNTSAATCTRRIYEKLLLIFERHIRDEENKPLPVTYMRPARKKPHEQSALHNILGNRVLPDIADTSSCSDILSFDQGTNLPNKITEDGIGSFVEAKTCLEFLTESKIDDMFCSQNALVHRGSKALHEESPDQHHDVKSNFSVTEELKIMKDNGFVETALPVSASELSSTSSLDVDSSCQISDNTDSSHGPSAMASTSCTEAMPLSKGNKVLAVSLQTSKQFAPAASLSSQPVLAKVSTIGSREGSKILGVKSTASTFDNNIITSLEMANSRPLTDQKSTFKDSAVLPSERIPSCTRFTAPLARTGLTFIRPTYGPPNLINSLAVLTNGHNEFVRSKSLTVEKSILAGQGLSYGVSSDTEISRVSKEPREKTPPRKCDAVGISGSWFNSPIKQFLDRTRTVSSTLRLSDTDDQPVDLSMKSLNVLENHMSSANNFHKEQEEPLNLSRKVEHHHSRRGVKVRAVTTEVAVPAKKPTLSSGATGKVVLSKSDHQFVPLILSVPSLSVAAPHSVIVSNVPYCQSPASLPNISPIIKSGFPTMPTGFPALPFQTSLLGATIRPVLQFFPSPGMALSSEAGRPLLLRFPLPMPVSAPVPTTRPSLLAPKPSRS